MTTANKITILRILSVPFFIAQVLYYLDTGLEQHRWIALVSFALAAICDGVDGYIARCYNQRSELGAILDPLADKLLLVSGVVLLSLHVQPYLERIPLWLTAIIIGRDVIVLIGLGLVYYVCGKLTIRPHFVGKMATVFQMVVILWILLSWNRPWLRVWIYSAGACTAISGIIYIFAGVSQLSTSPSSAPTPGQSVGREKHNFEK